MAFPVWRDYQPLALGVDKVIYRLVNDEHFPGASKKVVQKVLRMHTHHGRYLRAIQQGRNRFHLDGREEATLPAISSTRRRKCWQNVKISNKYCCFFIFQLDSKL